MKKVMKIVLIIAVVLVIIGLAIFILPGLISSNKKPNHQSQGSSSNSGSVYYPPKFEFGVAGEEDYKNFEDIIASNELIKALPDDGVLQLNFFSFPEGERVWEKSYILTKGNVELGNSPEPDITMIMHSKYLTVLNKNNLCDVIKTAKANGDFASETEKSKLSLGWKYKGVLEYRSCLGL